MIERFSSLAGDQGTIDAFRNKGNIVIGNSNRSILVTIWGIWSGICIYKTLDVLHRPGKSVSFDIFI